MPEGMRENDKFPEPIITPSTKADQGLHDEDISREAILSRGIVSQDDYLVLENYTRALFKRGTEIAAKRGLILVDTKYEFGKTKEGEIVLIDEIENGLHYSMHRPLLEFIFRSAQQLQRQIFITTHSSEFLDKFIGVLNDFDSLSVSAYRCFRDNEGVRVNLYTKEELGLNEQLDIELR